ncbi:MAG: hypothetical protein H6677_06180 [Candidatus Obscuribacterales bacterium]|nr:hypothetical protein [Candidatus Obscuribacterales bacterium]
MSAEASMLPNALIMQDKGAADTVYENENKQLESKTVFDDGGVLTHTEINGAKRLTEVTDAAGRNTKLGWSEDGSRIDTVTTTEGTWTRNPENPTEWTNANGEKRQFDIKVTNSETGELTYTTDDSRTTWKSDGEFTKEQFAVKDTVPPKFDSEGNRVQEKYVKFKVENDKYGVAKKVVDDKGHVYTPGSDGSNKLEINAETGDATIKDAMGNETTFHVDGSRTEKSYNGSRAEYNQNGNLSSLYNEKGELTSSYHYTRNPQTGLFEVDQISNKSGLWERSGEKDQATGRDVWTLKDADGKPKETIVGDIDINGETGDLSITTTGDHGITKTEVRKTDGSSITSDSDGNVEVKNQTVQSRTR